MRNLIIRILGQLIEINTKLDKNNFSISGGQNPISQVNGNVIFTTNQNTSLPLNVSEPIKIVAMNVLDNNFLKNYSLVVISVVSFLNFIFFYQDERYFQIFLNSIFQILFLGVSSLLLFFLFQYEYQKSKMNKNKATHYIELTSDTITIFLNINEQEVYKFEQLRKIVIKQNILLGYTVFIYEKDLIPSNSFGVMNFDEAYAIKEVFDNYLLKVKNDLNEKNNSADTEEALLG